MTGVRDCRAGDPNQVTVMLVDDEPTTLEVVQAYLEEAGYSRFVATTQPVQAWHLLNAHEPDVVLLDLKMPVVSGFDILARLRGDERWRFLPVIILTAETDGATKLRALELGATDILAKPVDASELVLRLRNALAFKAYQDRLQRLDPLTGLPNRREFMRRVAFALNCTTSDAPDRRTMVMLDLDRFKQVNDGLGHQAGDQLIQGVAQRLAGVVAEFGGASRRSGDIGSTPWLARMNSDKFMAWLPGGDALSEKWLQAMSGCFRRPFTVDGHELFVTASIGLASYPEHGDSAEALMQRAELAMLRSKRLGNNRIISYSPDIATRATERLTVEQALRRAIERGELRVHYQPKVDCGTLRMVGLEALVRWAHPQRGLLAPAAFISVAEEVGLIADIGAFVLRAACRQVAQWTGEGLAPLHLAVNLSAAQVARSDVVALVRAALDESRLPASRLTLELTESVLMDSTGQSTTQLNALKALGVSLSLDDFGTGYSSLTYLRRFPLDEIKIDRSFVAGLPRDRDNVAIINAILALGRELGLRVTAEGVETSTELAHLRSRGCDQFQGYLFSRPVEAGAIETMLRAMRQRALSTQA
ncbi:MAG: EAL domain-containing protein [Lautropia sp.]